MLFCHLKLLLRGMISLFWGSRFQIYEVFTATRLAEAMLENRDLEESEYSTTYRISTSCVNWILWTQRMEKYLVTEISMSYMHSYSYINFVCVCVIGIEGRERRWLSLWCIHMVKLPLRNTRHFDSYGIGGIEWLDKSKHGPSSISPPGSTYWSCVTRNTWVK